MVSMLYQAVVVAVLLYGSKTWCITDTAWHPLDGFHVEVTPRIAGKTPYNVKQGEGGGGAVDLLTHH